jgi:hypothetical protein
MEYCMPCMLLRDGMAPGSIAEVRAGWFTGGILGVPGASMIEPSLVMDSRILEAEKAMKGVWCPVGGTTGGRAMSSWKHQPEP